MQFSIPICTIGIDYFPKDAFEGSVGAFCKPIALRVVCHIVAMDDRVVLGQAGNHLVFEVLPLIVNEFYGTTVLIPDGLVKKFCGGAGCVVAERFGFHSFGAVVHGHQDVQNARLGHCRGEGPHEIQAPLLEEFEWEHRPMRHASPNGGLDGSLTNIAGFGE